MSLKLIHWPSVGVAVVCGAALVLLLLLLLRAGSGNKR